jgi:signal transduction histidine kinase
LDLRIFCNEVQLKDAIQEIDIEWMEHWHGYLKIDFGYEANADGEKRPRLTGIVKFKVPERASSEEGEIDEMKIHCVGDTAFSPISNPDQPLIQGGVIATSGRFAGVATLGPFHAEGYWFNRQRKRSELEGTGQYDQFNDWLKQWGGGLLVYRDGFRVYPYADEDDDWLHLDQRALRRRSFKLNRGQFVGYVAISSRKNRFLRDQTNRQGLVDSPEKRALVQCLQYAIWDELGSLVKKYELKSAARALGSVQEIDQQVKEQARDARNTLREISRRAPSQAGLVQELRNHVDQLELAWSKAKSTIRQQQVQADVYLHLAGVGILLEFIIHDLTRATTQTLGSMKDIGDSKLSPTYRSLFQQLKTLEKRLRVLDPVSTPGRQRKEPTDIAGVMQTLLDAHEDQFEAHKIEIVWADGSKKAKLESKVVAGQMYQIFENLIANSIYWLAHQRAVYAETGRHAQRFIPTITIDINAAARTISFLDNGPGIDPADAKKIFEPFFSKKPEGRGIGLYIVRSLCAENKIGVSLLDEDEREVHPGFQFVFP